MNYDFWERWKNKTSIEKQAIESVKKARELIIASVPSEALVAIYIKGSFTRREMKKGSDVDIVPIVTENKFQSNIFGVNSKKIYPCVVVPLSIPEFRKNKLWTKSSTNPDLRAKPDRFLKNLDECKLIYGKAVNPKDYPIRSNQQALKDEIYLIRKGYIYYYKIGRIKFAPLLKEVFWLTELEQNVGGIKPEHSFEGIAASVKDKSHIIHDALKLRKKGKLKKREIDNFITKLEVHLDELEKRVR